MGIQEKDPSSKDLVILDICPWILKVYFGHKFGIYLSDIRDVGDRIVADFLMAIFGDF